MSSQWYYARDGVALGPVTGDLLQHLSRQGDLSPSDLVWREGMTEWVSASSVGLGLKTEVSKGSTLPPPIPVSTSTPPPVPAPPPIALQNKIPRSKPIAMSATSRLIILVVAICSAGALVGAAWFLIDARRPKQAQFDPAEKSAKRSTHSERVWHENKERPSSNKAQTEAVKTAAARVEESRSQSLPAIEKRSAVETSEHRPNEAAAATPTMSTPKVEATPQKSDSQPSQVSTAPEQPSQTLFQQVDILRRPTFSIQGLETAQNIQYRLLSRLDLQSQPDGRRKVVQYVQDTTLLAADDLSRATFAKSLEQLKKQQYTYVLNDSGEVISFTGHKDNLKALPVDLAAATGFAVTSVIDEDGWKELAELTFLVPNEQVSANEPWKRQMTHDWGSLGDWAGMTTFRRRGVTKGIQEIEYIHDMQYTKPTGTSGALPFKITDARFAAQRAGGRLEYDTMRRQVRLAQEEFQCRGIVTAELLGQSLEIQLTEQQLIEVRIFDQSPK